MITGDYDRIRQLILILLDNAVKFSYENAKVIVNLDCQNGLTLTVTDYGSGIEENQLPLIFERFHKGENWQNKSGTGLGLAIASEIVKRHGACISATRNESTIFQVNFPS